MHKSIKDNNNTKFEKLHDNLNAELNGIQTVKYNLNATVDMFLINEFLRIIFGLGFVSKMEKYDIEFIDIKRSFTKEVIQKMRQCYKSEQ